MGSVNTLQGILNNSMRNMYKQDIFALSDNHTNLSQNCLKLSRNNYVYA